MKNKLPELILAGAFIAAAMFKAPIKAFTGLDMIEVMASLFLFYLNCKVVLLAIQIRSAEILVAPIGMALIVLLSSFAESIDRLTGIKTYDIIFALIFGSAGIAALAQIFRLIDSVGISTTTIVAEARYKFHFDDEYDFVTEPQKGPENTIYTSGYTYMVHIPRKCYLYVHTDTEEALCGWTRVRVSLYDACEIGAEVYIKYGIGRFTNTIYIKDVY